MEYCKATSTKEARWACEAFPLATPGDPRYVPLEDHLGLCRGGSSTLITDLDPGSRKPSYHLALAGPRGSGKSTLMLQSFAEFRSLGLFSVHIDVLEALDPGDISYSDLLLTLVSQVDAAIEKHGIEIKHDAYEDVRRWFVERVLTEEHVRELGLAVDTGVESSLKVPFVGRLFAKVTSAFKGGSRYREEIRQRIDRSPNELVEKINLYLDAATAAVREHSADSKEIMVFFDNLEKVTNASLQIDDALVRRAPIHRQIRCTVVYTIPFGLLFNPGEGGRVDDALDILVVPMVALRGCQDPFNVVDPEICERLAEIIRRRIDIEKVFEDSGLLHEIVRMSGGCPRDLLHLTRLACQYSGDQVITEETLKRAINRGRVEHLRPTRVGDFERLAKVHRRKQIENTEDDFRLLYHRVLLHFNDSDWYDVHPLVVNDTRFIEAMQSLA